MRQTDRQTDSLIEAYTELALCVCLCDLPVLFCPRRSFSALFCLLSTAHFYFYLLLLSRSLALFFFSGPRFRLDKLLLLLLLDIISSISKLKLSCPQRRRRHLNRVRRHKPPRRLLSSNLTNLPHPAHNPISAVQSIASPNSNPPKYLVGAAILSHPVPPQPSVLI